MTARLAAADDLDRLAGLCRAALAELSPQRGGHLYLAREVGESDPRRGLEQALGLASALVLAGQLGPATVGLAAAHVEDLSGGGRLGRIDALYVSPPARGVGVGDAMMRSLLDWCGDQGCTGVDAWALPGAREVKNFFEAAGFSARLLVMHHVPSADA